MTQEQKQRFFERLGITPGPWEYISANGSEGGIYQRKENGYIGDIYFYHHKDRCQERDNNGRLISLSPEMFLALVEQTLFIETVATSGGKAKNPEYSVIQVIQNASEKPWQEVKKIYEECL